MIYVWIYIVQIHLSCNEKRVPRPSYNTKKHWRKKKSRQTKIEVNKWVNILAGTGTATITIRRAEDRERWSDMVAYVELQTQLIACIYSFVTFNDSFRTIFCGIDVVAFAYFPVNVSTWIIVTIYRPIFPLSSSEQLDVMLLRFF